MSDFRLEEFGAVVSHKQKFFLLYKNDKCQFEEFCDHIEKSNNKKEEAAIRRIVTYMQLMADLKRLADKQLKDITPA